MSEDPTQNLEQKYDTKPTIETVLTEMRAGFAQMNARIDGLEQRLNGRIDGLEQQLSGRIDGLEQKVDGLEQKMEKRFDAVESRLDDMARKVKLLNGDVLQLRSDLERVMEKIEGLETHFKEPA